MLSFLGPHHWHPLPTPCPQPRGPWLSRDIAVAKTAVLRSAGHGVLLKCTRLVSQHTALRATASAKNALVFNAALPYFSLDGWQLAVSTNKNSCPHFLLHLCDAEGGLLGGHGGQAGISSVSTCARFNTYVRTSLEAQGHKTNDVRSLCPQVRGQVCELHPQGCRVVRLLQRRDRQGRRMKSLTLSWGEKVAFDVGFDS